MNGNIINLCKLIFILRTKLDSEYRDHRNKHKHIIFIVEFQSRIFPLSTKIKIWSRNVTLWMEIEIFRSNRRVATWSKRYNSDFSSLRIILSYHVSCMRNSLKRNVIGLLEYCKIEPLTIDNFQKVPLILWNRYSAIFFFFLSNELCNKILQQKRIWYSLSTARIYDARHPVTFMFDSNDNEVNNADIFELFKIIRIRRGRGEVFAASPDRN